MKKLSTKILCFLTACVFAVGLFPGLGAVANADQITYIEASHSYSTGVTYTPRTVNATLLDSHSAYLLKNILSSDWYFVRGTVTIGECLIVSGKVNLILCDGATLNLEKGINLNAGNTLNIYAQIGGTGTLTAKGVDQAAGIGSTNAGRSTASGGTLVIHGGIINATGGAYSAGIGGGNFKSGGRVTIYGGTVTATGGIGKTHGIGMGSKASSSGFLTVYGNLVVLGGDNAPTKTIKDPLNKRYRYMKVITPPSYIEMSSDGTEVTAAEKTAKVFTVVDENTTAWGNDGMYVVSGDVTLANRITVSGTVSLLLCDNAVLSASKGITVESGDTLNIYAQKEGTGTLTAKGSNRAAGIGSNGNGGSSFGNVTIHGGNGIAAGGTAKTESADHAGAGIGGGSHESGGNVTIYSGIVTASGGAVGEAAGAGIGGGYYGAGADVTIYGDNVTANGGDGAQGIGAGRGSTDNGTIETADGLVVFGGTSENPTTVILAPYSTRYRYMQVVNLNIPAPILTAAVSTVTLQTGTETAPLKIIAEQGTSIQWSTSGTLPSGLSYSINGNEFVISGTVSADAEPGYYIYTVTASNIAGTVSKELVIILRSDDDADPAAAETTAEEINRMSPEELQENFSGVTNLILTGKVKDLRQVLNKLSTVTTVNNLVLSLAEGLTEVNLEDAASSIEILTLTGNSSVKTVEAAGSPSLKILNLKGSKVETVDAKGCGNLVEVNVEGCKTIEYLDVSETSLTSLNVQDCTNLLILDCSSCDISTLNIKGCVSLMVLNCTNNQLSHLDLTEFNKLTELTCKNQHIYNWLKTIHFNILDLLFMPAKKVSSAADDEVISDDIANVKNLTAFDLNGQEIYVTYNYDNGEVTLSSVPSEIKYDYVTGFRDVLMDVTVSTSDEEKTNIGVSGSGSGCDTGLGLGMITLMLMSLHGIFTRRSHR